MSLTRKLLKELELTDTAVERIIAAHVDTVNALREERDNALAQSAAYADTVRERDEYRTLAENRAQEASCAREELLTYQAQVTKERHEATRRSALTEALAAQGANPQAIPLLLVSITLREDDWDGDCLKDAAAALQPWRAKYGALFAIKSPMPVTRIAPPVTPGGALTHADVKRMSADDINRSWSAVQKALRSP